MRNNMFVFVSDLLGLSKKVPTDLDLEGINGELTFHEKVMKATSWMGGTSSIGST